MLYRQRLRDEDVLHDRKTMRDEGEIIRIIRYEDRIWKWGVDIVRFLYVRVIHVSFSGVDWNDKGGAGREWRLEGYGGVTRLESQCTSFETWREWKWLFKNATLLHQRMAHADKETTLQRYKAHSLQSSHRKKNQLPNPLCILLIGRPRPLGCPHSIYWKTK